MAKGALRTAPDAQIAIAITGIAGPGGGTADKPVGLVWFGLALRNVDTITARHIFTGDRAEVRHKASATALGMLLDGLA